MRLAVPLTTLVLALAACSKSSPGAAAPEPPTSPSAAPASPGAPAAGGNGAWVTTVIALRRAPSDAAKVPAGTGKKDVNNYLATLHRGEKVDVLEQKDDWARVRLSDDREGWLRSLALLQDPAATAATVLVPSELFDRPELIAAVAGRKLEPGTLVLVTKQKPPFAQVNFAGALSAWVLSERLATGEKEVAVSKLVEKARWLFKNGKKDEAREVLGLAREHFAGVALIDVLDKEIAEPAPAPADAAVVPAATDPGAAAKPADDGH